MTKTAIKRSAQQKITADMIDAVAHEISYKTAKLNMYYGGIDTGMTLEEAFELYCEVESLKRTNHDQLDLVCNKRRNA